MVNSGQREIRAALYSSPADAPYGVEVMSFAHLRSAFPGSWRTNPQRTDFHVLGVVTGGRGRYTADFVGHPLTVRAAVWLRPGVVHQWDDIEETEGVLVLFRPDFLRPGAAARAAADAFGPAAWEVSDKSWPRVELALHHLAVEYRDSEADRPALRAELLQHLLQIAILRTLPETEPPHPADDLFPQFRAVVERHYAAHRDVAWYAKQLGYAPRTLSRASQAATGVSAKQFIDERVVLEAKRLLAHADLPVATIAHRLGFDDTNFTKFFRRHTTLTPKAFRDRVRAG
ncbi:helix-turn-helix domain-containing protein [Nocardia sp. NPDC020380]|uniref:helix-turn-helix domain-containing protein n=1 Tax=Nocardia sp. NPDC020380 TaxID=3364309 RepID=UPI00379B10F0